MANIYAYMHQCPLEYWDGGVQGHHQGANGPSRPEPWERGMKEKVRERTEKEGRGNEQERTGAKRERKPTRKQERKDGVGGRREGGEQGDAKTLYCISKITRK